MNSISLQFQVGEWTKLANINLDNFSKLSEKQQATIYKVIGLIQIGNFEDARFELDLLLQSDISKSFILSQMLSSVYNNLGKARAVLNEDEKAYKHFSSSISIGFPKADQQLATALRSMNQYSLIGIRKKNQINSFQTSTSKLLKVKKLNEINLGLAWAGNTVNTVIFCHHGIFSWGEYQYNAFYVDFQTLRVVQRSLQDGSIVTSDIISEYNLNDAHNSISLGIDRDGCVHLSYDHHETKLKYRKTINSEDISKWTEELPMTGKNEDKVTYPTYILPNNNSPLLMLYREGHWKSGRAYIKAYNEKESSWNDYDTPILSGSEQKPWSSNAYWNHPVNDNDGILHLSYVWRTDYYSDEKLVNNINIGYACSYDSGKNWYTSLGHPYILPITQTNSEVIWPISPNSNLINQTGMALDSKNRPHIVFYANDEDKIPQYQHIWFDGKTWQHSFASNRQESFSLSGGGTLQIPISRPDILVDDKDNVYMIHRGKETRERMAVTFLEAPYYEYDQKNTIILYNEDVGFSEPIIDRVRWEKEKVLSILIQNNEQPNGESFPDKIYKEIKIIDLKIDLEKRN